MNQHTIRPLTTHEQGILWQAIDDYAATCGASSPAMLLESTQVGAVEQRQGAITAVMRVIDEIRRHPTTEAFRCQAHGPYLNDWEEEP